MLRCRNGPGFVDSKTPPDKPGNASAATSQCRKYIRLWAWRSCPGVNGTAFGSRREGTLALKGRAFRPSENAAITMRLSRCGIRLITIPLTPHTNSCRPMPSAHLLFWFPRGPTALPPPQPEGRNNNSPGRKPWVNAGKRSESLQGRHSLARAIN